MLLHDFLDFWARERPEAGNCGRHKSGLDRPANLGSERDDGVTRFSCFSLR